MACSRDYVTFVCDQLQPFGAAHARLMFGDYMVYLNAKPLVLICDDTAYIKRLPALDALMQAAPCGVPYSGASERYILDIEDRALLETVIPILEENTPIPKPRRRKARAPDL